MPSALLALLLLIPSPPRPLQDLGLQQIYERAVDDFLANRIEDAVAGFDELAGRQPQLAPRLWERGIALYYAGRYQDCREQFESHRRVNPADVENAAWHFLCVAKQESPARARELLLPVGRDGRSPMPQVYEMFQGTMTPGEVLESVTSEKGSEFYAHLYLGLYYDAIGDSDSALEHVRIAAEDRFGAGYMQSVARIHLRFLEGSE